MEKIIYFSATYIKAVIFLIIYLIFETEILHMTVLHFEKNLEFKKVAIKGRGIFIKI